VGGPSISGCYELRGLFGDEVQCNAPRPCETAGFPCERNGHCCGILEGFSACVNDGQQAVCSDLCERSVECVSECCVPLEDLALGACGLANVCL
jgi:hypothetical protein